MQPYLHYVASLTHIGQNGVKTFLFMQRFCTLLNVICHTMYNRTDLLENKAIVPWSDETIL